MREKESVRERETESEREEESVRRAKERDSSWLNEKVL